MSKKIIALLCNVLGTLILAAVIALSLAAVLPRLLGYEIYHIISGSMEPEIPVGSVIYVSPTPAEEMREGEIAAFWREDVVVAHRVLENNVIEGQLVTKGDANEQKDIDPVAYRDLIGRVERHFPYLGAVLVLFSTTVGKIYVVCFAACGAMLNILGGRIRQRARENDGAADYR